MNIKGLAKYMMSFFGDDINNVIFNLMLKDEMDIGNNVKNKLKSIQITDVTSYKSEMIENILRNAYKNCPYYTQILDNLGFEYKGAAVFHQMPLLDKNLVRINKNGIISKEFNKHSVNKVNTGGSTGEPLEFYCNKIQGIIDKVHQEFLYEKMGFVKGDLIIALDGTTIPQHLLKKEIYWVRKGGNIPYGSIHFSSMYINDTNIHTYLEHLCNLKPQIIRGYPSFLNTIAEYILKNNILLEFHIKGIELTSEMSHDWQIENIKKAFGTNIFFQYGHGEACIFAFAENTPDNYLCSPFYGIAEVINETGDQVEVGEIGEIVVTSFYNKCMPLIRYRTGDMAQYGGIKDGCVLLTKLIGRTQDYIYNYEKDKFALTAVIFGQHYTTFKNIKKWQIVQNEYGKINIRIVRDKNYSKNDEKMLYNKFKKSCGIDSFFKYDDQIDMTKRGKLLFVIQNINH